MVGFDQVALFLLVRAVFVSLTHVAPSPIDPQQPAPFLNSIFYGSDLLTTENAYLLVRFLGQDSYYLLLSADKQQANLGNMRHLAHVYAERLDTLLQKSASA